MATAIEMRNVLKVTSKPPRPVPAARRSVVGEPPGALPQREPLWMVTEAMAKEKELLETEKGRLESEKLQWTQVQSLMELEKSELQADIQKAKEERKRPRRWL